MRSRVACLGLLTLLLARPSVAQERVLVLLADSSLLEFEAAATVGSFRGVATDFAGTVRLVDGDVATASGTVRLMVAGLRTGIGRRDGHLRDELRSTEFPQVLFTLLRVGAAPADTAMLHGTLEVRGVERVLAVPAQVVPAGDGFRVRGEFPIRFTDFDIEPPRRLLGLARVGDELKIRFDLLFTPAA